MHLNKNIKLIWNCFFYAELLSRHLEHFWLYHCSWQHHGNNCGLAGKPCPKWQSTLKGCRPKNKCKSRKFRMQHQMFSSFLVCDGLCLQCWLWSCCVEFLHLWFTSCHCCPPATLSLSDCITLPLINSCGGPSRWTQSTWVSWSFFGQPGWSSCWDRATRFAFYFGHLYSPLRSESFHYY